MSVLSISIADWVQKQALNQKVKNKSARYEELMIKGLMFEQMNGNQSPMGNKNELMECCTPDHQLLGIFNYSKLTFM